MQTHLNTGYPGGVCVCWNRMRFSDVFPYFFCFVFFLHFSHARNGEEGAWRGVGVYGSRKGHKMNKNIFSWLQVSVSEWVRACSINGILRLQRKCTKASDFIHCPRTPDVLFLAMCTWVVSRARPRWEGSKCKSQNQIRSHLIIPECFPVFWISSRPAIYHIPDTSFCLVHWNWNCKFTELLGQTSASTLVLAISQNRALMETRGARRHFGRPWSTWRIRNTDAEQGTRITENGSGSQGPVERRQQGVQGDAAFALALVLGLAGCGSLVLASAAAVEIKMFTQPNANDVLAFRRLCPSAAKHYPASDAARPTSSASVLAYTGKKDCPIKDINSNINGKDGWNNNKDS